MFIVSIEYTVKLSKIDQFIAEHIKFLNKYYERGYFLSSGPKVPRTGGVILAKADSKEQLRVVLAEDPFYQKNLASYEITEFSPNRCADNIDGLACC